MKQFVKYFLRFLVIIIIAFIAFFFWASSSTLNSTEYKVVSELENKVKPENDTIFSIVTYNIGYLSGMTNNRAIEKPKQLFDNNMNKVLLETKNVNPDIIAFQEIDYNASRSYNVNQETEIAALGFNYAAKAVNWDERYLPFPYWPIKMHFGKVVSGQSIISKYPLKEHQRIVLQRVESEPFYRDAFYLERLAQVVKVVLNGQEVVLINIHLEAFDKATRVNQFEEVLAIFNKYKNDYPTILLGDFNSRARDKDAVIQKMFAMKGIGNAAFDMNNLGNTFDTKNPFERIDYIFYTKNSIEYISGKVLNQFEQASDHLPVEMQFKLK
ncbi:Metal-dependent hydrolase, endonuclease/exonuclease/phosphatase family [Polaribacter sp. Hel1_33_78]|uniref:endonuclease/exonuclease/phosphatase family protein n=1 Tax=unclassified Polaribacter TaxID=196858 RepID=UPI00087C84CB|nr:MULTISPECIES: endonuclease/exonuclease/phosphatase family protein [unclassified Polaribacter]MBT3742445.1 endonuclease/exonuclease/phosphatase [Polaribacter sp.]MDG1196072.1 endonuclease/exonuclease/phosphatase family protein [Polaribacter sp.]MDG1403541.1 endonuclease/exonuclease/phosphatase family protein [Polaribacter sp.]MDG2437045.1 endonuclease/exonuclease/phosphatase family protein [Polaribacter sp.]SDU22260.1 Metal-dependent hydrolase, endonuclease/exonuclease/phosphatase family [Po